MSPDLPARRGKTAVELSPLFSLLGDVPGEEGASPAVLDLTNGQLVPLDDLAALAAWRVHLRDVEDAIRHAKRVVDRELIAAMDRRTSWTMPAAGKKLTAPSPEPSVTWDGKGVYQALTRLVRRGVIDAEAVAEAVDVVPVQYVAKVGPIKQLCKVPAVAKALERHKIETPKGDRTVSVKAS